MRNAACWRGVRDVPECSVGFVFEISSGAGEFGGSVGDVDRSLFDVPKCSIGFDSQISRDAEVGDVGCDVPECSIGFVSRIPRDGFGRGMDRDVPECSVGLVFEIGFITPKHAAASLEWVTLG